MSRELSLFLLALVWVALAFSLGYVVGSNRTLKAMRSRLPRRPYDQERDR